MLAVHRTRVKICGITRLEDGLAAANAGADAIGFVFYNKSPRAVAPEQAAEIARKLPPFVTRVGLFVNAEPAYVEAVLAQVPLDLLQFHGEENADYCRRFARPYIKALRMKIKDMAVSGAIEKAHLQSAIGILLDSWDEQQYGGTGKTFDWTIIEKVVTGTHIVLAGGLTPSNVAEAIRIARPWAVDVSSGVEREPGIKDKDKIEQFISEVRRA